MLINDGLINGDSPDVILDALSGIGGHNTRQYGICDTIGRTVSFSGKGGRNFNGGLIGNDGDLAYAIQGNSLAGQCVIAAMQEAILIETNHDIPQKLMAAMQAARISGGDGRCSCDKGPDKCDCRLLSSFTKSAHVGFMLVTRLGDTDDSVCNVDGCADGDYFMTFDVISGGVDDDDPVLQLQAMFDARRIALLGKPDAIQSSVMITPGTDDDFVMTIELKDWQTIPGAATVSSLTVVHEDEDEDNWISTIGTPSMTGVGIYTVALTDVSSGTERFIVTADNVILTPFPVLNAGAGCSPEICDDGMDNDCDGLTDLDDPDCSGGPGCDLKNEACSANSDCCSGKCRNGKCVGGPTTTNLFFEPRQLEILALAANNVSPLTCSVPSTIFN
jgi:hypothetical protein